MKLLINSLKILVSYSDFRLLVSILWGCANMKPWFWVFLSLAVYFQEFVDANKIIYVEISTSNNLFAFRI
jgi:hypothetical protein